MKRQLLGSKGSTYPPCYAQEHSPEWASKIQAHKFRWHNSQWLDMVEGVGGMEGVGGSGGAEELLLLGGEGGLGASFLHHSDVLASQHSLYSGEWF